MTPDEHTNQEFFLDVGDGHQIYVQDWGNIKVKLPVIVLHGGPGSGTSDRAKNVFDPSKQRVIFFDQRGSGRSLPAGEVKNNDTSKLIKDIDALANHLGINKFVIYGRSWGSLLALIYAIHAPARIEAIVTGGIFLGSTEELDFDHRAERYKLFFPEAWGNLLHNTPEEHHNKPILYHAKRILDADSETAKRAAFTYSQFILSLIKLDDRASTIDYETFEPAGFKIEAHYKLNGCFVEDDFIIRNAPELKMPIWIVQGRYDVLCTPAVAYELHKNLPSSKLSWVTAGHSSSDRAIEDISKALLLQITGG